MNDLNELAKNQNREALLLAEVTAWLHNLGKLDPNFLVIQTHEPLDILDGLYRIPLKGSRLGQYSIRRFCQPFILESNFPYAQLTGILYFPDYILRMELEELQNQLSEIKSRIGSLNQSDLQRSELGKQSQEITLKFNNKKDRLKKNERDIWNGFERSVDDLKLPQLSWSLGSLLTMFWESEWFSKPVLNDYEPGSESDPDYQRKPIPNITLKPGYTMELPALLLLAHGEVSGQEKKGFNQEGKYIDVKDYCENSPSLQTLRLATAFGYETLFEWRKWQNQRKQIMDIIFKNWRNPIKQKKELNSTFQPLRNALGDTQRPINEISLWDYSHTTAALFKTAIVRSILTGHIPTLTDMRWRLVSVHIDAFHFLFQVNQLSDLLARRRLLDDAYKLICQFMEIELPIGSEIYADEHCLVFVLPEIPDCSDEVIRRSLVSGIHKALGNPKSLETLQRIPTLYGALDLPNSVKLTPPQRGKKLKLQDAISEKEPTSIPDPCKVAGWWLTTKGECCTVCGLRPVGYIEPGLPSFVTKQKAIERHLCGICLARRGRRAQEWSLSKSDSTIWIDEVADANGRMALIVGRFDLDDWIDGTLVRSLAIGKDKNGNSLAKPPTFARIHRVWRTTAEFWQNIVKEITCLLTYDCHRLLLQLDSQPDLGDYHAYELDLDQTTMSVVWVPPRNRQEGHLISADNLEYIAKQLGAVKAIYDNPALSVIFVESVIKQRFIDEKYGLKLRNPEDKLGERERNLLQGYKVKSTDRQNVSFSTAIPILAEPSTFMALVPADKALQVVEAIKTKYEREMGKVRNRLPIHMGIVYAGRRTPLRAVLDAGRRMLEQKALGDVSTWEVLDDVSASDILQPRKAKALGDGTSQFKRSSVVHLKHKVTNRSLTWLVPAVMGDGETVDNWYPYVFWMKDKDGNMEPAKATDSRSRSFQAPNPWTGQLGWLVHAGELKKGDQVYFTPATLDYQWLDSAGLRFEIAYDDKGQRRSLPRRPYLLDELETLNEIRDTLKEHLIGTQIHALRNIIEAKRAEWQSQPALAEFGPQGILTRPDDVFWQFCYDALANADWLRDKEGDDLKGKLPWEAEGEENREDWLAQWANYAARGWLTDVVELYLQIMKEEVIT